MSEARSLAGRRVLVTRAPHQASELVERLWESGAEPVLIPAIAIVEPASWAGLDEALGGLSNFDWLVFTSANAVRAFEQRAIVAGIARVGCRVAVIGRATERAATTAGLRVDLVPPLAVAESLAEELARGAVGRRFLLVRAAEARDVLPDALREAGGEVTVAEAYRNEMPAGSVEALRELLGGAGRVPDAVTFTSASTVRNLAALMDEGGVSWPQSLVRASIGPITSAAMRELGLEPQVEAGEASVKVLVEALAGYFARR